MLDTLRRTEIFQGLSLDGLADVAERGWPRAFPAGAELMRQGEPAEMMYVILAGRVRVERSHPALTEALVLAELGPGETVGEMGILDGQPRSATVTAIEDAETLELTAAALFEAMAQNPEVAARLLRLLSARIQSTNILAERTLLRSRGRGAAAARRSSRRRGGRL